MNSPNKKFARQERLEILLAMTVAALMRKKIEASENAEQNIVNAAEILTNLSALQDEDMATMREKIGYYDALTDEEKRLWQTRILNKISNRSLRLDADVHHTQIAEVLAAEPDYLSDYIMQRLPPDITLEIAADLQLENFVLTPLKNINSELESLLRRRFLNNFVNREDLYELKPLAMLNREDVLDLVQRLGRIEMAFVCRSVKDVENLAPFLRRFEPEDSQAILELMADLRTVEQVRLDKAEQLIKQAWAAEKHPTLIIQSVGLNKLAAALCGSDEITVRYTLQKMPVVLAVKVSDKIARWRERDFDTEVYQSEVETVSARILLDKMTQPEPENDSPAESGEKIAENLLPAAETSVSSETVEV